MPSGRWLRLGAVSSLTQLWPWALLLLVLVGVRLSKGAPVADLYALVSFPFWPGTAQREWLQSAQRLDDQVRLRQLQTDNERLRNLLDLKQRSPERVAAPVIGRDAAGWWHTLRLGRGSLQGLRPGQAVLAPGGLIGRITAVTPATATVTLLTDPASRVGVWVDRVSAHGLLAGAGAERPELRFVEKDPHVRAGDVVVTSPASTLVPPNLPVGVVQRVNEAADPAPVAIVQLIAPVEAVDWVQVLVR
jgi:rod shape-determining protein MreC